MELKSTLKKSKEEAKRVQGDWTSRITLKEKTIKDLEKWCNYNEESWQKEYDADEKLKLKDDDNRRKEEAMIQEENLELQDKYESLQRQSPKKKQKTEVRRQYGASLHLHNSRSLAPRIGYSKEVNMKLQDKNEYLRPQSTKKKQKTVPNGSQLYLPHSRSRASSSVGNKQSPIYQPESYSGRKRIGSSKDKNESFRLLSSTKKQNTVSHGAQPHPPYSGSRASSTVGNGQRQRYQPERYSGTGRTGSSRELRTRTVMGIY